MARRKISKAPANGGGASNEETGERLLQFGAMGKAFSILETITASNQPFSMAELARETGLTKPTAHRIIGVLSELGFVERDQARRGYVEGPRLIQFALNTLQASAPRAVRHGILRALSEECGETCNFGILAGPEVIYLDRVEAKWPLGLRFEPGSHVPAHCTAIGKLLLGHMPRAEREELIRAVPLTRYTGNTITSPDALLRALNDIARKGVATDNQEFIDGVVCVAVPVTSGSGDIVGGIAMSAPEARITIEEALRLVPQMRRAAARLGKTYNPAP